MRQIQFKTNNSSPDIDTPDINIELINSSFFQIKQLPNFVTADH